MLIIEMNFSLDLSIALFKDQRHTSGGGGGGGGGK